MLEIQTPVIPVIADLINSTPGTISFGQGVVYYPPPEQSIKKLHEIGQNPVTHHYSHTAGISGLRELIVKKLGFENHISVNEKNIVVTAGANMAFLNALFVITKPGDEVIQIIPYYFNHEMAIRMVGCKPVLVKADEYYLPSVESIKSAITVNTRAIVTISPNNPTGTVYPKSLLEAINALCKQHGIYHISDEAYEYFTYAGNKHFSPGSVGQNNQHTISLFSLSKSYGFANLRIGYMVIPDQLIESIYKAQDTNLICPPIASQYAAIGALEIGKNYCLEKIRLITEIRDIMLKELQAVDNFVEIYGGQGAFYLLLKLSSEENDMKIVEQLITEYGVATLPGSSFGLENGCYLRIAFGALDKNNAIEGIRRLNYGLTKIVRDNT